MTRHDMKVAGIAALAAFASTAAWSQERADDKVKVAAANEVAFADEVAFAKSLDYPDGKVPTVNVTLVNKVDKGEEAEIIFTLSGAQFAQRVRSSSLKTATSTPLKRTVTGGGGVGDGFVEFTVVALDELKAESVIGFELPTVRNAGPRLTFNGRNLGVRVGVEIVSLVSVGDHAFPDYESEKETWGWPKLVVMGLAGRGLTLDVAEASHGSIDVENRVQLVKDDGKKQVMLELTKAGITVNAGAVQSDGKLFGIGDKQDGAGYMKISLRGSLAEEDTVFYDLNGDDKLSTGEDLAVSNGMASSTFRLSDDMAESDRPLYYMPGGGILRPGAIHMTVSVDFDDDMNHVDGRKYTTSKTSKLDYSGTSGSVSAYAIAPPAGGAGDVSNVRVKCEGTAECQIYFACDDIAGADLFGKVAEKIPARATKTYRSGDIAKIVGEEWTGRLACNVISVGSTVSVQVLTRSGGTLVNNTYVNEPPPAD